MRKCLDCGAELDDVAMKCSECGSENLSLIEDNESKKTSLPKKPKTFIIIISVIVILGIIASIVAFNFSSSSVPAKPVEKALTAFYTGDLDTYVNQMYGVFQSDAESYLTNQYGSYSAYEESTKETLKATYGDNYKIEAKVIDVYPLTDKLVDDLKTACSKTGYKANITDARNVTVRIVTKGDDGQEEYYIANEYSAEVGGKWYLIPKGLINLKISNSTTTEDTTTNQ